MAQNLNMTPAEHTLVANAVGAATLDRLRGFKTTLAEAYAAKGGQDAKAHEELKKHDSGFGALDFAKAAPDFHQHFQKWNMSSHELSLVQRAIGTTVLARIEGKSGNLVAEYKKIGGKNAEAIAALEKYSTAISSGDPGKLSKG